MARGWESKSVEGQIDAAADAKSRPAVTDLTPAERERLARRASLLLARTKAARDLESTHNPRRRAILERALADLDAQRSKE